MTAASRRLIAVDAQNLLGCNPGIASTACWEFAIAGLLDAVGFRKDVDHLVIAVAPDWAFTVKALAPCARLVVCQGPHGADVALCDALADTAFIASRYSEVVIASGDHVFCAPVRALADAGVPTTVACLPHQTSSELTDTATSVTWLDRPARFLGETATVAVAPAQPKKHAKTHAPAPVDADPVLLVEHTELVVAA